MPKYLTMADVSEAMRYAEKLQLSVDRLEEAEVDKLDLFIDRVLKLYYPEREIREIILRHKAEIVLGAMVAKKQLGREFDGEEPRAGTFGVTITRAAFFGIGDDWEDAAPFSTGSPQNWIHSGTTLLGGTAGNPIKIGENAVHVVIAIGSLHPSPKIESIKFSINGAEKPVITLGWLIKTADITIRELEKSMILKKNDTALAKVFISAKYGSSVDDYPFLLGVSYLPEDILRLHDAAEIAKSTTKVVLTT